MNSDTLVIKHPFNAIFNQYSLVLILGSFPSVKSRENNFYYSNPQNRFWKIISTLTNTSPVPTSTYDKTQLLIKNKIALWDVVKSCNITGSSDNSIKNVETNDLLKILNNSNITKIYANGNTAYNLYMKHCFKNTNKEIFKLPSTSPANATYNLDKLIEKWSVIKYYI